ncbi:glycine-rich domain-containing protein [Streptomyces cinnamoneus]|uniref:glycine-rich domain-containing protein n=1 Tax=Streptomyces cinnamoneus TaxID=53446 RepID=UPI00343F0C43
MFASLRGLLTGTVVAGLLMGVLPAATAAAGPVQMAAAKRKVFLPHKSRVWQIFTVPAGVTALTIDAVGGGGGGGAGTWTSSYDGGQGGGAGAVVRCQVAVRPRMAIAVQVGYGGNGGPHFRHDPNRAAGLGGQTANVQSERRGPSSPGSGLVANAGDGGQSGYNNESRTTAGGKGATRASCVSLGQKTDPVSFTAGGDGQDGNDVRGGAGGKAGPIPAGCPKGSGAGGKGGHSAKDKKLAEGHRGGNACVVLSW